MATIFDEIKFVWFENFPSLFQVDSHWKYRKTQNNNNSVTMICRIFFLFVYSMWGSCRNALSSRHLSRESAWCGNCFQLSTHYISFILTGSIGGERVGVTMRDTQSLYCCICRNYYCLFFSILVEQYYRSLTSSFLFSCYSITFYLHIFLHI